MNNAGNTGNYPKALTPNQTDAQIAAQLQGAPVATIGQYYYVRNTDGSVTVAVNTGRPGTDRGVARLTMTDAEIAHNVAALYPAVYANMTAAERQAVYDKIRMILTNAGQRVINENYAIAAPFKWVDPTVTNRITPTYSSYNAAGPVAQNQTVTITDAPGVTSVAGQSTVKTHYLDVNGNPISPNNDGVFVKRDDGWPSNSNAYGPNVELLHTANGVTDPVSPPTIRGYTLVTTMAAANTPGVQRTMATNAPSETGGQSIQTAATNIPVPDQRPDRSAQTTGVYYVYRADVQNASVVYIDDTTGNTLATDSAPAVPGLSGPSGSRINYSTATRISDYQNQGYELVSDNFTSSNQTFNYDTTVNQRYEVHLRQINPDQPGEPPIEEPPTPIDEDPPLQPPVRDIPPVIPDTGHQGANNNGSVVLGNIFTVIISSVAALVGVFVLIRRTKQ
jgi:hypothetical protein